MKRDHINFMKTKTCCLFDVNRVGCRKKLLKCVKIAKKAEA